MLTCFRQIHVVQNKRTTEYLTSNKNILTEVKGLTFRLDITHARDYCPNKAIFGLVTCSLFMLASFYHINTVISSEQNHFRSHNSRSFSSLKFPNSTETNLRISKIKVKHKNMVSQVICVICSVVPEPHTTEITFYKFPNAIESPAAFRAWKTAFADGLATERPELLDADNLTDTYVCSRHFTATDFAFENGKLVLVKNSVPSRITKSSYEVNDDSQPIQIAKDYEPSSHANNFARTLTKNFMTTSRQNIRTVSVCTETSRAITPSASEYVVTSMSKNDGFVFNIPDKVIGNSLDSTPVKKRPVNLEQQIESFAKIFKRMRSDNLLTETYVQELKVIGTF